MAQSSDITPPILRAATGSHRDDTARQLTEEHQHLIPPQLLSRKPPAGRGDLVIDHRLPVLTMPVSTPPEWRRSDHALPFAAHKLPARLGLRQGVRPDHIGTGDGMVEMGILDHLQSGQDQHSIVALLRLVGMLAAGVV